MSVTVDVNVLVHAANENSKEHAAAAELVSRLASGSGAHLVALMHEHDVRVIHTLDRGFRRFEGIEVRGLS